MCTILLFFHMLQIEHFEALALLQLWQNCTIADEVTAPYCCYNPTDYHFSANTLLYHTAAITQLFYNCDSTTPCCSNNIIAVVWYSRVMIAVVYGTVGSR